MDISKIIESIIDDLVGNDKNISTTFLKLQVLVHKLKNERLKIWFDSESHGYKDLSKLPDYRVLPGVVYGDVEQDRGFDGRYRMSDFMLPISHIKDQDLFNMLRIYRCEASISKIETIANNDDESICVTIPDFVIPYLQKGLQPNCYINQVTMRIQKFDLKNILEQVRSLLLQFLLEINEELDLNIDFTAMENKEKIEKAINHTIYASVVATGENAVINANNSNNVGGLHNSVVINSEIKSEIEEIVGKITDIANSFSYEKEEVLNELARIMIQLNKSTPKPDIIASSLQIINGILTGVAGNMATPLIISGIQHILSQIKG